MTTTLVLCLQVEAEAGQIAMALVQNKVDLLDQAAVRDNEAQEMAKRLRLRFYRACVKDNLNVAEGEALPRGICTLAFKDHMRSESGSPCC